MLGPTKWSIIVYGRRESYGSYGKTMVRPNMEKRQSFKTVPSAFVTGKNKQNSRWVIAVKK